MLRAGVCARMRIWRQNVGKFQAIEGRNGPGARTHTHSHGQREGDVITARGVRLLAYYGSKSTNTALGTCLLAPVSEKMC